LTNNAYISYNCATAMMGSIVT